MTDVQVLIKYDPDTINVSGAVIDRLELWRKATDGIGRLNVKLKNDNGEWLGQFAGDDPIEIKIANVLFLRGYLDSGVPISESAEDIYKQFFELAGRDYGQDLQNKLVDKTGDWMYKSQPADDIIADMLTKASAEITFTSPSTAPQIQYTDTGEEFLIEAFRKICEKINYDLYVDENKALQIFPIDPSIDSGIILKCVAGAVDNNILGPIRTTEFDVYELRNYIVAKSGDIEDGWSEGNKDDYTGATGNVLSNEYVIVHNGAGSIKCARGTGDRCELGLIFPKYNYDDLSFDLFGIEDLVVWCYVVPSGALMPSVYVTLEDTDGHRIKYFWLYNQTSIFAFPKEKYVQGVVPIGTECEIKAYLSAPKPGVWIFDTDHTTFNWKITKVKVIAKMVAGGDGEVSTLIIDGLRIPLPMVAYKQDGTSQGLYKVRHWPIMAKDVYSQMELNEFAASELEKRKDVIAGLKITAVGTAGIISNTCKWIPGYKLIVNSPGDGFNNAWYRITEVHIIVTETPLISGYDFVAEVTLVPHLAKVSGRRLSYVDSPEIALFRALNDKIRFLEKKEEAKRDWWPPLPTALSHKYQLTDVFEDQHHIRWDVMMEGTESEMWLFTPDINGMIWICTDTNRFYRNNGSTWILVTAHPYASGLWQNRPTDPYDGDLYLATDLDKLFRWTQPLNKWMPLDAIDDGDRIADGIIDYKKAHEQFLSNWLIMRQTFFEGIVQRDDDVWYPEGTPNLPTLVIKDGLPALEFGGIAKSDWSRLYSRYAKWGAGKWRMEIRLRLEWETYNIAYWGGWISLTLGYLFFYLDYGVAGVPELTAEAYDGVTPEIHAIDLTGIDLTVEHRYRIDRVSATEAKFYIDDVLKATCNTHVPPANLPLRYVIFQSNQIPL